jgi:hypothetical protein
LCTLGDPVSLWESLLPEEALRLPAELARVNGQRCGDLPGIKVIDVGMHLAEPGDLRASRAPAKYRDLVSRVL